MLRKTKVLQVQWYDAFVRNGLAFISLALLLGPLGLFELTIESGPFLLSFIILILDMLKHSLLLKNALAFCAHAGQIRLMSSIVIAAANSK